jgi:hypothetical protein
MHQKAAKILADIATAFSTEQLFEKISELVSDHRSTGRFRTRPWGEAVHNQHTGSLL